MSFERYIQDCGAKQNNRTSHILRHSFLTYAVGESTDYKTVQGISGHSDVFTLMNRYAHPQAEKMKELTERIGNILT